MLKYYRIIPIASKNSTILDTIRQIADATNKYIYEIILMMGFESEIDLMSYCDRNPNPHFNKYAYVAEKLNDICRQLDSPIRVIRPDLERSNNEYYKN